MARAYMAAPAGASLPTLTETWEQFRAERAISVCPTSLATDYRQTGNWIRRCPIQDLEQGRQVILWTLQQDPPKAARRVTMFLRSMYRWASSEDIGLLKRNPVATFKLPKAPQGNHEVVVITKEELRFILIALEVKGHHRAINWAWYAEWMLQTAMRTGEVRALRWQDIDGNRIRVHANFTLTHGYKASTKTNKARWVPLNARALEILEQLPRDSEFCFPWNRNAFASFWANKVEQLYDAGLIKAKYRPYDLRHVAISRWLEAGIPVTQAASWAGNTSEVIWKHYAGNTKEYEMPVL